MPSPFAALEQRTHSVIQQRLSNAAGTLAGAPISGMFDGPYAAGVGGAIAGALPQLALATSLVPAAWEGEALHITEGQGIGSYTIRNHQPDGLGMSILELELAP